MDIDHPKEDSNPISEVSFHRRREALGIAFLVFGIFFTLSLLSSLFDKEWMGVIGKLLATFVYYCAGLSSIFLAYGLLYVAVRCLQRQPWFPSPFIVLGFAGLFVGTCILLQLVFPGASPPLESFVKKDLLLLPKGGIVGVHLEGILYKLFGTWGIILLEVMVFSLSILALSSLSYKEAGRRVRNAFRWVFERLAPRTAVANKQETPPVVSSTAVIAPPSTSPPEETQPAKELVLIEEEHHEEESFSPTPATIDATANSISSASEPVIRPRIQEAKTMSASQTAPVPPSMAQYIQSGQYQMPSLEILQYRPARQADVDRKAMLDLAQRLEKSLADYQVKGRVTQIHPGPVVTMFEFAPAAGTKLSKITALSSDLAMILEAQRVRIVAPIPGKAVVGIEVPNVTRETVYAKEIVSDTTFAQSKSKLTLALGKDIVGVPVCVDLAKMPHLLIAGTTGSGKSVAVNVMIASILFRASPDEVKVIMIDPKMLELSIYEGIPHLLLPVVTDPKKANLALKWAVDEMDRRYDVISKAGVRDIASYNRKAELQESEPKPTPQGTSQEPQEPLQKLPFIVVIIDEFADLMMVASKEVEVSVARIAQKARAAGIHLVLATQRPSVDVITGLIKANFPSRIAFQVASRIDSRTILDTQGAESLLGMGDMLFTDRGQALRRIHGALITDDEIHKLVEHLKKQGSPIYDMDILKPRESDEDAGEEEDMEDELYDQAVRIVAESQQASISMVQRRLRIGYNRAARMIERMEREGVVSKADGAKGREVLVRP